MSLEETINKFPPSPEDTYDKHIKLYEDSAIIIGDSEIPDHDRDVFAMAAEIGYRLRIQTLIINGDFMDCDAFSKWSKITNAGARFSDELEIARGTVTEFLTYFPKIYIVAGNHDRRIASYTNGQVWVGMFLNDMSGVEVSEYAFLEMQTPAGKWLICHPKQYSRIPLSTARELCSIKQCHVLCAHNHHLASGHDKSGMYYAVDGGCCRDPMKTSYRCLNVTTHPYWTPGFTVIKNGVPLIVSKQNFKVIESLL